MATGQNLAASAADLPAAGAYEYGEFIAAGVLPFCITDTGKVAPGSAALGLSPSTTRDMRVTRFRS